MLPQMRMTAGLRAKQFVSQRTIRVSSMMAVRRRGRCCRRTRQVRDRLPWTDTAAGEIRESALSVGSGLSMMRMSTDGSGTSSFQPLLGQLPPERIHPAAAFVDLALERSGPHRRRRHLLQPAIARPVVTNKEGGAHVDEDLPSSYVALTRENSIGITQVPVPHVNGAGLGFSIAPTATGITRQRLDGPPLENSCVLANIRQIAWELPDTIRRHLVLAAPGVFIRAPICPLSIHESPRPDRHAACPCGSGRPFERCSGRDCLAARSHFRSSGHDVRRRAEPVRGQHRMAPVRWSAASPTRSRDTSRR